MNVTRVPPSSSQAPLLSNRNFVLLWAGQSISLLGDAIFNLTLVVWVAVVLAKQQPWAPLAVSGMLAAETLPVLLVGPLAGVFVDRWNKRWTMLWCFKSLRVN